ncbi:MAG: prenyltransferase [Methanoregulaceae archaeon]|nr:prenyltransferase [Methanoregulaceae archaeon]
MKPRTLWHILRIEGLVPFTGSAILIGFVVTLWETGFAAADWSLFVIAVIACVLVHIDAHIWNDIMDLEIDRGEKSRDTGRDRPLVFGWATVKNYRTISAIITITVVILAAYLTIYRVFIPLLFILGFFFDYGYNHPRIALGHQPFTEWYIFPWLVVGVTMTVVYAATNIFSLLAFILSLLQGMTVTCFGVSMMRRDVNSDRQGGKCTTSVRYPEVPHATIYGILTMLVSVLTIYPLALILGIGIAYLIVLATASIAVINTILGARIDQLCTRAMYSFFPDFEAKANKLMLQQVGASMVHAIAIAVIILVFNGRIP